MTRTGAKSSQEGKDMMMTRQGDLMGLMDVREHDRIDTLSAN
jgi:hypothetical protein